MTFDGRITQAQNDASAAVHEAESFENRVNAAINTANNAANTATIAQGIAVNANQTAAQALDELNAQRDELESIAAGLIDDINDEADAEKQDIQNLADSVIASIPSDYTQLSADVKNKAPLIVANASGEIASFKDGADDMEIRHLLTTFTPIQTGTGEPSPSNVRPISGRTTLSGARTGKNLIKALYEGRTNAGVTYTIDENGVISMSGTATGSSYAAPNLSSDYTKMQFFKAGTYTLSGGISSNIRLYFGGVYADGSVLTGIGDDRGNGLTYTFLKDFYIYPQIVVMSGTDTSGVVVKPMLVTGSTAADYEPYNGRNISVNWQTEAGTVYLGSLDVITGELISHGYIDLGSLNWIYTASLGFFQANLNNLVITTYTGIYKAFCSNYPIASIYAVRDSTTMGVAFNPNGYLYVRDPAYTDPAAFKTAMSGVQLVYELATPNVYHLDPVTVKTLLGYNTIYTDCGPVSVDYPADTKLYIDGKFAELQALVLEN